MRWSRGYGLAALLLFAIEVLIALYVHDDFVRPYVGDVLVVILLHCLIMTFVELPRWTVLVGVLLFACTLEVLQYFHLVTLLGLQNNTAARVIIGTTYSTSDLLAYAAGTALTATFEALRARSTSRSPG